MSHRDWKRYYAVVYDKPPVFNPIIWREREWCLAFFVSELMGWTYFPSQPKPIGIVRIRGNKRHPELQRLLLEQST